MTDIPYREAVGNLFWLSLGTKLDISYVVSQVARYIDCYGKQHLHAVKRIFRYLNGTIILGPKYCSINYVSEFTDRFESLKHLNYGESLVYSRLCL